MFYRVIWKNKSRGDSSCQARAGKPKCNWKIQASWPVCPDKRYILVLWTTYKIQTVHYVT